MVELLTWFVGTVSFLLSGVHVYWVSGGRKGLRIAVPTAGEEPLFRPSKSATGVVAVLLAAMGWFVFQLGGYGQPIFPEWLFLYVGWGLAILFILRAIGDFRWLGFFKSNKGTPFAEWDSVLFSPLCLLLGVSLILITVA